LLKIFIISFINLLLFSCSSQKQKFKIDNSASVGIDSIFKANGLLDTSIKHGFSFHIKKTFDYERFGQNNMDLAYFLKRASYKPTEVYISSMSDCYLSKDTIILIGVMADKGGIGFRISIFDDKYNSQLRLIAVEKIYSKTEKKNDLQEDIFLNPDIISLTLTEKPKFKTGSSLKGKMAVKYEPFYQVDSFKMLSKISPQFDIIFDTEIHAEKK